MKMKAKYKKTDKSDNSRIIINPNKPHGKFHNSTSLAQIEKMLLEEVEEEIEFECPVRGKVKQLVKVKRYRAIEDKPMKSIINSSDLESIAESVEEKIINESSDEEQDNIE